MKNKMPQYGLSLPEKLIDRLIEGYSEQLS